jgi:hypothetical protein
MKNLFLIFYLTAFAFFNQSCHKNEDAPLKEYTAENLPPLKNVRVEDNTLHFDNVQQYADTVQSYLNLPTKKLWLGKSQ